MIMSRIKINPYITFNTIETNVIVLNEHGSRIFQLDDISSEIWYLIANGMDIDEIVEKMKMKYQGDDKIMRRDIEDLINKLIEENLLICE